jgi:hypothetical protein
MVIIYQFKLRNMEKMYRAILNFEFSPQKHSERFFFTEASVSLISSKTSQVHRKKLASVGAANQVFFVVTKSAGTAPTAICIGEISSQDGNSN